MDFRLKTSPWAWPFLALFARDGGTVSLDADTLRVRMGRLGSADVPLALIASVGSTRWPWWGGLGVRIARSTVAFAGAVGDAVVIDLREPVAVRAPLGWQTSRLVLVAEAPAQLAAAIAAAVGELPPPAEAV